MNLTAAQRRYLLVYQSLVPCVITVMVCGVIGLLDYRNRSTLPVWGLPQSMAVDLTATSFLLPFVTCLIATSLVRRDIRRGVVSGLSDDVRLPGCLRLLDRPLTSRAVLCGLGGLLLVGASVLLALSIMPLSEIAVGMFLTAKLTFAGLLSSIVTPPIALLAMHDR